MIEAAAAGLVFVPLLALCALLLVPARGRGLIVLLGLAPLPLLLVPVTTEVWQQGVWLLDLGGLEPPLGIRWRIDALSLTLLWLCAIVFVLAGVHAMTEFPPSGDAGGRNWPLWMAMMAGINALLLSADLFNVYVTLELVTLAAIGLVATSGKPAALRAAMRYLLLALMASLLYLLGVGLIYAQSGSLDLYQSGQLMEPGLLPATALTLMVTGLLVKAAIFPLHVWLPAAHGNAPGPVSALLSAIVVKVAIYLIWRLWFWTAADWDLQVAAQVLGGLGALAILYGSLAALVQKRLKMIIAYSTVAQIGYLMLVFPLAGVIAWQAASYHLVSHGLAKAAMFLAAANILHSLGTDRLWRLSGLDQRLPVDVFTLALASVSLMGLPPSGGFVAKWLFLQAAWNEGAWLWMGVIVVGGLLAAAYLFRILAITCFHPAPESHGKPMEKSPPMASLAALVLALLAVSAGFASSPVLELLATDPPPGLRP